MFKPAMAPPAVSQDEISRGLKLVSLLRDEILRDPHACPPEVTEKVEKEQTSLSSQVRSSPEITETNCTELLKAVAKERPL